MSNFIEFKTTPDQWGIFNVIDRIEQISKRFAPPVPAPQKADFQAELKSQLYQPGADDSELIPSGALNKADNTGMPTVEKGELEDLFDSSAALRAQLNGGPGKFDSLIKSAASKYNLDENLIREVMRAESNFNPVATSPKGAMGLMQLMPGTANALGVGDAYDPSQNVDGGARYLRQMLDRFGGDKAKALAAYNAGPQAVETYNGIPPYKETKGYVSKIMNMIGGRESE